MINYDLLKTVITYPLILGVLVVVHEWGHFIVARIFKIRVDEFSIGFGPRAFRIGKIGDTEYNIRWIPLGGYVKIAGMEPDEEPLLHARDKAKQLLNREEEEAAEAISKTPLFAENLPNVDETPEQRLEDAVDGFYSKPLWQRSLVIFAGPFMSFVLGYVLLCSMGSVFGLPQADNSIDHVNPNSVAAKIGLRAHDRIIKIDNTSIANGDQMVDIIHASANKELALTVERGSRILIITGTPAVQPGSGTTEPIFGFAPAIVYIHESFIASVKDGTEITEKLFSLIGQLVARHNFTELRHNIGGPTFIAETTYQAVKQGPASVVFLAAQLTISLAIFNLVPIPVLDGGHLLLFAVEGIRRGRRLTMAQQQQFMLAGLAIIGLLFVAIMINDLTRFIHH